MRIKLLPDHIKYDLKTRFKARFMPVPSEDAYLKEAKGIVHIGAHWGQERYLYRSLDLDVLWVEGNPEIFSKLSRNLANYTKQNAINALLSDEVDQEVDFLVSSNHGMSSSILGFSGHKVLFPGIDMTDRMTLRTETFESIIARETLDVSDYDALTIDVQGAELMVLRGMGEHIKNFRWLKLETSDIETYEGGQTYDQLVAFLEPFGFKEIRRQVFRNVPGVGTCFDLLMERDL